MNIQLKRTVVLLFAAFFTLVSYSQKQKKTYNSEKFVKKVQFSMVPELIGKRLPDDIALKYISEKSGESLADLKIKNKANNESLINNVQDFIAYGLAYIIDKSEVLVKQESPVKIADIILYCHTKSDKFTITLSNCVQTNISWYLGDAIVPEGDGFESAISAKAKKQPGKFGEMLIAANEIQKSSESIEKTTQARADSLRQARPGYETKSNIYYNHDWADLPLPGYYIKNNGEKITAIIGYQRPQFIMGISNALFICKEQTGVKIDALNAHLEKNFKEWVKYEDIKAFYVADQLFIKTKDGNFTILVSEGAIHTTTSAKMVDQKKQLFTVFPVTQKLDGRKYGTVTDQISEFKLLAMMEDAPQIVQGYKDGKYSLNEAEIRYNIWYEENNPGKINYVFGKDYGVTKKKTNTITPAVTTYEKEVVEKLNTAHVAPKQDYFEGRPLVASPPVASAKPEVRVKKESFLDRLNRIKMDGNKVGVLVRCENIYVNPEPVGEGVTKVHVVGSYKPLNGIEKIADNIATKFNEGFGIDVFDVVNYSLIPIKDGVNKSIDDWWSTKYKIIIIYDITPYYTAIKTTNSKGDREFKARMKVNTEVIMMSAEDKQQTRLKYVTNSPAKWGYYKTDFFIGPATTNFDVIQDLKEAINPPNDDLVIEALINSQQEKIQKFIKRKSK